MNPSDSRQTSSQGYGFPCCLRVTNPSLPGLSGSSTFPSLRAIRYHPDGPTRCTCWLLRGTYWLHPNRQIGHPYLCVSRLNPVQPYGLRLTASPSSGPPPSPGLLHPDRPRFPCSVTFAQQAAATYLTSNYMATSFQIARKARLNLTHLYTQIFTSRSDAECGPGSCLLHSPEVCITIVLIH